MSVKIIDIYTDGSYSPNNPGETYGAFIVPEFDGINGVYVSTLDEVTSSRNIGGELLGAIKAVEFGCEVAKNLSKDDVLVVHLVYDYEGVGKWLDGRWKTKKAITKGYKAYIQELINKAGNVSLKLDWVKGHADNAGNNDVDELVQSARVNKTAENMDSLMSQIMERGQRL